RRAPARVLAIDVLEESAGVSDQTFVGEVALADRTTKPPAHTLDPEGVALLAGDGLVGVLKQRVEAPRPAEVRTAVFSQRVPDDVDPRVRLGVTSREVHALRRLLDRVDDDVGRVLARRGSPPDRAERALV